MNEARLVMLARRHAPLVPIIAVDAGPDRVLVYLECGHTAEWAPHFLPRGPATTCDQCGRGIVRQHPAYRNEFT